MDRRFNQTTAKPMTPPRQLEVPPGMHVSRRTPIHPPTVTGQVWVPFLRSVFTGLWVMLGGIVITNALAWPWWVPLIFFVLGGMAVWCAKGLSDQLLYLVEEATGRDIDQDGEVGRPEINIDVSHPFSNNMRRLPNLPCTMEQLEAFAIGVTYEGKTLSISQWYGEGKPFRRSQYEDWLAYLVKHQMVVWRDKQATSLGRIFTAYGRDTFRQVADQCRAGVHVQAGGISQALHAPGVGESVRQIEHTGDE